MTDEEKVQIYELHKQGLGYKRIAEKLCININSVKTFLRRSNGTPPIRACDECGKPIEQIPHKKPKRFCSDTCRFKWWGRHKDEGNKTKTTLTCEYCGKEFTVYGSKKQRYCSTSCYAKVRTKANNAKRERLIAEKTPCGTELQNLPTDCLCASCPWFVDGKRSCPCKKEIDRAL